MAISGDQSFESLGKSFLKATTTFFWSTSAVPTSSVLSSPSPSLLFTLGKAVRNWFFERKVLRFLLDMLSLRLSLSPTLPSV